MLLAEQYCESVRDGTHASPKKHSEGKHLITSKHLKEYYLDFENAYLISEKDYEEVNRRSKVDQWDILFGMIGTIGEVYLEGNENINYAIKNVGLFKNGKDAIKGKWLKYYLKSRLAQKYIQEQRAGTTQEYITLGALRKFPIVMPSNNNEKNRIITILESLSKKTELNQKMNKTLENIAQAIFKHWFIDFEFPNEEGKPYKSSGGEIVDSEIGEVPGNWKIKEISECGQVVCGKTPPTADKENFGADIFFITIPDMRGQTFVIKTERKLSKQGAAIQKNKELPPFAICVSCIATPGLVSITSDISHTNQQINSIIADKDISPFFMYFTMLFKSEEVRTLGLGGTATLNLNTGNFARIKIGVPNNAIINKFHKTITPLMERIMSNSKENMRLCDIRDSLLPKLMSGKIRVA